MDQALQISGMRELSKQETEEINGGGALLVAGIVVGVIIVAGLAVGLVKSYKKNH